MFPQIFLIFLLGLSFGSFINVFIDRNINGESIVFGKSHCDRCKKNLAWYDLIPLLSFIFLLGKCRYCHTKLSFYYPIAELSTAAVFVLVYLYAAPQSFLILELDQIIKIIYYLFMAGSFIAIFFSDLKYGIIPDKIVYPAVAVSLIFNLQFQILPYFLSALGAFLFFLILILATKGKGMGIGDLKLVFLMGLFLGFPKIILALYLAFLTGAVVSIILILCGVKKLRGSKIPFGPFLVLGTFLALFYLNFFNKILFSNLL